MHKYFSLTVIFTLILAFSSPVAAQTTTPSPEPTAVPTCATSIAEELDNTMLTLLDFSEAQAFRLWANVDDDVMGGVSESGFTPTDHSSGLFSGNVSLENNGGFASLQARFQALDLSAYSGIELSVCGDGQVYGFYLTDSHNRRLMYQGDFQTTAGEWQTIRLRFAELEARRFGQPVNANPLDTRQIVGMAFIISDKQAGVFALEVARISAWSEPVLA